MLCILTVNAILRIEPNSDKADAFAPICVCIANPLAPARASENVLHEIVQANGQLVVSLLWLYYTIKEDVWLSDVFGSLRHTPVTFGGLVEFVYIL
jgi:hypothetical protein